MKILFISEGGNTCDYMRDASFHGLRSLLGPDVVDVNRINTMYKGYPTESCYGRGYSLYGLLPDDSNVDRTDIPAKIRNKYFDIIAWGSIHRNQDYLAEAESMYDPSRLLAIDGEDHPGFLNGLSFLTFKRELYSPQPRCLPIHFAIPREKISDPPVKSRLMAPCDPLNRNTYIYTDEDSYYAQYADSHYGATMKKAGWDCLRHYEMLSQWCIPYFRVFDQCPPLICHRLPRKAIRLVQECFDSGQLSRVTMEHIYDNLIDDVMSVVMRDLTTEALARYIFDSIDVARKETVQCVS